MEINHDTWQWQEPGTAWRGIGIYHVTLTVTSRQPVLGSLVIPDNDPKQARVEWSDLGNAVLDCHRSIPLIHPEIQILQYSLMPDHLHSIWYVRTPMEHGIRYAVQGFWRAVKKIGRAYSYLRLSDGTIDENGHLSFFASAESRDNPLRMHIGEEEYRRLNPLFSEMPFIRPLSRKKQLQTMIHYVQMNPQRLATKRLMPEFFRVQEGIEIAGQTYCGVGNIDLLQRAQYMPVHVRSIWVENAEKHGDNKQLRDYMNSCVLAARQGTVMVSPFISKYEQMVMEVLLKEGLPFIYIADNGFRDYYKPQDCLFDAVAAGRVLILSPWEYDPTKHHVTRPECVAMNKMAEKICYEL